MAPVRVLPCSRFAYVKPNSINALAKLRDDKAVPDGVDVRRRIERGATRVKACPG